jgi:hypothetical protein
VPEVVRLAIDQYQPDNAPLHKNWLDQRWAITWSADDKVTTADIWDDFDDWAKQKRITEKIGKQKFFKWLESLDGVSRPDNGRIFTGLRLKTVTEQMAVHLHNMSWGDDQWKAVDKRSNLGRAVFSFDACFGSSR